VGLNYTLFEDTKHADERATSERVGGWSIKEIKLGAELFGALGALGLTLDPNVTEQYAEVNLKSEFSNGMHIQLGAAAGLTKDSERDLLRIMFGYEFE
jgi:hypothetical protein